jgi:ferric-chelate reductase
VCRGKGETRETDDFSACRSPNLWILCSGVLDVAYLCVAIVLLGVIPGFFGRLRCRYPQLAQKTLKQIPGIYSLIALLRGIAYYQPKSLKYLPFWNFPSLGPFILNWSFCLGLVLYCFCVKPYYRLNREWGSPPLAIRAGMLANGLFPILFALSTKVNVITVLTAISHERLQVSADIVAAKSLTKSLRGTD